MNTKFSKEKYIGLGHIPIGIGAVIKGWNVTEEHFRNLNFLPVVDFFAMTNACPHNCFHCFTNKNKKTLTLDEIKVDEEYGFKHEIINNFLTSRCVEFLCIRGDGIVEPCPGNESIVGNVKTHSIKKLRKMIIKEFPGHNPSTFDGYCCYRERF